MRRTFRLIFLWPLILWATLCHAHRSCQTPDKNIGQCVHFSSCRFVLQQYAMYKEHMPPHIMRFLQRSRCRPKVEGNPLKIGKSGYNGLVQMYVTGRRRRGRPHKVRVLHVVYELFSEDR